MRGVILWMAAWLVAGPALVACGDVLVTKDGKKHEGRVLSESEKEVVFEVHRFGAKMTLTFEPANVARIDRGALPEPATASAPSTPPLLEGLPPEPELPPVVEHAGPTYYRIPLEGAVGDTFNAEILRKSLEDALKRKPTVVILEVDSPGGLISEVELLLKVIREYTPKLRIVVFAREAISAAAIVSLSAKEIYMRPAGLIGAALAIRVTVFGPMEIAEKMQSVWRAIARSAAETGGHSTLLAEAMIDANMELHLETDEAGVKTIKVGRAEKDEKPVTAVGKLLTLTAKEAEECGLSNGTFESYEDLGKALGFEKWQECPGAGTLLAEHWRKTLDVARAEFKKCAEDFGDNMRRARDTEPRPGAGGITRDKWLDEMAICTRFLAKAENAAKRAADLAEKFPQLSQDAELIRESAKEVSIIRERINIAIHRTSPLR